jgi:two-component system, NtrC family, sensor histidine kinase KinB
VPVLDSRYQATGVLLSFKDVTQQQYNDDMKRGLVSTVSHQLKTPLTSIRMAIHLLLEEKVGTLTEKQAELLLAAREDSDRLNTILEDLLDISRIESGKARMNFAAVSPQVIASEAAEHFAAAFQDRGISLNSNVPNDLPEVMADATRIVHVFDNLLSNALKHTSAGGAVTISARADEELVVFSVADTGTGIPREYLNNIFEQFFSVPGQVVPAGAGLGLAIAREIVEAHGGKIAVESTEGEGSIFHVALKRAEPGVKEGKTS